MDISLASPVALVCASVMALMPPPDLTGSQWAQEYRVLSREDSAAPGPFNCESRPYQNEIMDVACDSITQETTVKGCSQWGKTVILLNILGFFIHLDPGPIMVVNPTITMAEQWSKTRLAPMLRDSPALMNLVADVKSRDSSNTILSKKFPGGLLVAVGAGSPASLASQPIRVLLMDETDRFSLSAGTEGDPQKLAEARTADFRLQKKIYRCSTPTVMGASNIDDSWKKSDQRHWLVKCPHCGLEQSLSFWQVCWDGDDYSTAKYACKNGCEILEPALRRIVREGRWVAAKPEVKGHAGFDVPGVLIKPMVDLARGYIEAKASGPKELQVFYNTQLGELWNAHLGEEEKVEGLLARARMSDYVMGEVPAGVGMLVAGIDVQGDRVECVIRGIGKAGTRWTISRHVIAGNTMTSELWDRLEALLCDTWVSANGHEMRIRKVCIDAGFQTKEVKKFAKRSALRGRISMVKGATRRQYKWTVPSKTIKNYFMVDTVSIKDMIYDCVRIADKDTGGFQWFPKDTQQDYFDQLMSNRWNPKTRLYDKISDGRADEVLDCHVYCEAALELFAPRKGELEEMVAFYDAPSAQGPPPRRTAEREKPMQPEDPADAPEAVPAPAVDAPAVVEPPRPPRRSPRSPGKIRSPHLPRRKPLIGW